MECGQSEPPSKRRRTTTPDTVLSSDSVFAMIDLYKSHGCLPSVRGLFTQEVPKLSSEATVATDAAIQAINLEAIADYKSAQQTYRWDNLMVPVER